MNRKYNDDQIRELHLKGLTDAEIAEIVGATSNQMAVKRRKLGLKPNNPREDYVIGEEMDILIGTLLGDACVRYVHNKCKYPSLTISHSTDQKEWFMWKYNKLIKLNSSYGEYKNEDRKKIQSTGKNMKCLVEIRDIFYKNNVKIIPIDYIKKHFTDRSLFCMYMDDGSFDISSNSFIINTQCFKRENLLEFTEFLKEKFDLEFSVKSDNSLYLKHCSNQKLIDILYKYNECDSMFYKFDASRLKTPLNRENPKMGNPVLNPQETEENAERLTVMPNEKDEAIKSDTKAGHCSE